MTTAEYSGNTENVTIEVSLLTKLNLADFQNSIALLHHLCLHNETGHNYDNIVLTLTASPPFIKPRHWRIDTLAATSRYRISDTDVHIDSGLLARLTETQTASISLVLKSALEDDLPDAVVLTRCDKYIELLPPNQWGGLAHLPDVMAAFVQPNDPAIDRVLKKTADILRQNQRNPAIDGYASGAQRAWELASAIWSAVASMQLDYVLPPASFEHQGQKVRNPSHIERAGIGTCFDLTLFCCAALEQAGLHPLVIVTRGHAFAGVWLQKEEFSATVVDDVTALRKRLALKELVVFESTLLTQRPVSPFSAAVQHAAEHLDEANDARFCLAIDIRRARLTRIKPLNQEIEARENDPAAVDSAAPLQLPVLENVPLDLPDSAPLNAEDAAPCTDRLLRWQRKLLNLSLRNKLLHCKNDKKVLSLDAPDPGALEDLLANGHSLKLRARPLEAEDANREREEHRRAQALQALLRNEVFVPLSEKELDARLLGLFRESRTHLQETGANTLYLVLGFLSWKREGKNSTSYRAPLILVPVILQRKNIRSGFTLCLHEDEPRFNPTLIEMLRQDFHLNLGALENELPQDDAGLDVAAIWRTVNHAIKDIKGWEVTQEVTLAQFSFAKYLMWKDLALHSAHLRDNAIVRHLLDTPRDSYRQDIPFVPVRELDQRIAPQQLFCPLPFDSSQLSAILAASQAKDFVLIGPPGTGKSQTIVNLIAQSLAQERRVLFVSEKIAALDVVYRRLRDVGLGEFCLELHSSKARKIDVLSQLQSAWANRTQVDAAQRQVKAEQLQALRDDLNHYVERLHHKHPNGWSIFDAIGIVSRGRAVVSLDVVLPTLDPEHEAKGIEPLRTVVESLTLHIQAIGQATLPGHPLALLGVRDWTPSWQQQLVGVTHNMATAAHHTAEALHSLLRTLGLPPPAAAQAATCKALLMLSRHIASAVAQKWPFVLEHKALQWSKYLRKGAEWIGYHAQCNAHLSAPWPMSVVTACIEGLASLAQYQSIHAQLQPPWSADTVAHIQRGLALLERLDKHQSALSVPYGPAIEALDVAQLQQSWQQAQKTVWPSSWLQQRKVRQQLSQATKNNSIPEVADDLRHWNAIRALRAQLQAMKMPAECSPIWSGPTSDPTLLHLAMRWQKALAAVHQHSDWQDSGFEAIASGRCGPDMQANLQRARQLRQLRQLHNTIASHANLEAATDGLWKELNTQTDDLRAALNFVQDWHQHQQQGILSAQHPLVEKGRCGVALAGKHKILMQRSKVEQALAGLEPLRAATAGLWQGLASNVEDIGRACQLIQETATAHNHLRQTLAPQESSSTPTKITDIMAQAAAHYTQQYTQLTSLRQTFVTIGAVSTAGQTHWNALPLETLEQQAQAIATAVEHHLRDWCAWGQARERALQQGLAPLVQALERGDMDATHAWTTLETNYARCWLNAVVDSEPAIFRFVRSKHEKHIRDFCEIDEQFTQLSGEWLRARLSRKLPEPENVSRHSPWGVLRHEISKKRNHLPLRTLLATISEALAQLTPCLLMSPLSIAQYLQPGANSFDLVIFDEASQIPVWDAIGAMARGRQVIMVGDPKQLPPSGFFDRAESGLEDDDVEVDTESILDECLSANLPVRNLQWHYRSRNESLIAFSNHIYYGGELITFPSTVAQDTAVSLHRVANGIYQRGGARTNPNEARALVADVVARLKSPEFRASQHTIGIVTFNAQQQGLIENLLDEARRNEPQLEACFADSALEPLFVKNLENVQGDERDIIYFSVTFGHDLSGQMSLNFGPLNRVGGERRLNVAITRARRELRVFASFYADQMNVTQIKAQGVRDLQRFLDFAERGTPALAQINQGSIGEYESPLEQSIAAALIQRGWHVQAQIGVSSFRIDLGIIHPEFPGCYLAGVECDGATYHSSATARDRDKLREQVLRGLGWSIVRVWSTDWWLNPTATLEQLEVQLHHLLATDRQRRTEQAEREARALAEQQAAQAQLQMEQQAQEEAEAATAQASAATMPEPELQDAAMLAEAQCSSDIAPQPLLLTFVGATPPPQRTDEPAPADSVHYRPCQPEDSITPVPERFYQPDYSDTLLAMIALVVAQEGPIEATLLAQRIARAHGWMRTGKRIREHVLVLAAQHYRSTEEEVGTFYWPAHLSLNAPVPFRPQPGEDNARTPHEICLAELTWLAHNILAQGVQGEAIYSSMATQLGIQKLRTATRARLERAVHCSQNTQEHIND